MAYAGGKGKSSWGTYRGISAAIFAIERCNRAIIELRIGPLTLRFAFLPLEDDHYEDEEEYYEEDEEFEEDPDVARMQAAKKAAEDAKKAAAQKAAADAKKAAASKPKKQEPAPVKVAEPEPERPLSSGEKKKIEEDNRKMNYELSAELFGGVSVNAISRPSIKLPRNESFETYEPKTDAEYELFAEYIGGHVAINSVRFHCPFHKRNQHRICALQSPPPSPTAYSPCSRCSLHGIQH